MEMHKSKEQLTEFLNKEVLNQQIPSSFIFPPEDTQHIFEEEATKRTHVSEGRKLT